MNAKQRRQKAKATREAVKRAEAEHLAAMMPQQRQIYQMDQGHADRLHVAASDRNKRYDVGFDE